MMTEEEYLERIENVESLDSDNIPSPRKKRSGYTMYTRKELIYFARAYKEYFIDSIIDEQKLEGYI